MLSKNPSEPALPTTKKSAILSHSTAEETTIPTVKPEVNQELVVIFPETNTAQPEPTAETPTATHHSTNADHP